MSDPLLISKFFELFIFKFSTIVTFYWRDFKIFYVLNFLCKSFKSLKTIILISKEHNPSMPKKVIYYGKSIMHATKTNYSNWIKKIHMKNLKRSRNGYLVNRFKRNFGLFTCLLPSFFSKEKKWLQFFIICLEHPLSFDFKFQKFQAHLQRIIQIILGTQMHLDP